MEIKAKTIIALTAGEDLSGKEGYFIKLSAGKAILVTSATDKPFGVLVEGAEEDEMVSIAVCGGNAGSVHIALGGIVSKGDYLQLEAAGDCIVDAGSGARVITSIALEAGVKNQLIEGILLTPVTYSA